MESKKLFYTDPCLKEFTAQVVSCTPCADGFAVVLDQTAFYPGGGGQPCDTGFLNDIRVENTAEQDGSIVHICQAPLQGTVTGRLDWQRRLDFMQQHTGEHILSGILHKQYGAENTGFHMGGLVTTVDFSTPVPPEDIPALEALANRAVFENLPVNTGFPDEDTLKTIPYRCKRELAPPVRIVTVPDYDCCACCGIHTAYTGQVGMIKILSVEKFHQGVRMEMVCGGRALSYFQQVWEQNKALCRIFSAKPLETAQAGRQAANALEQGKFDYAQLQKKWFASLAGAARGLGNTVCVTEAMSVGDARNLAEAIGKECGGMAAVLAGKAFCLFVPGGDGSALGRDLLSACGGRGGGRGEAFQGTLEGDGASFFRQRGFAFL